MPTVAASVIQPQTYVRLMTSWADVATETYVRFTRINLATCEEVAVRVHTAYDSSGEYILLSCDQTAVVWDTEAPLETNLQYRVDGLTTGLSVTSGTVNIDNNGENHLKDPLQPCHDLRVASCIPDPNCPEGLLPPPGTFYIGHSADVYDAHSINLLPVNATRPITVSQRRQDAQSTLVVGTRDCEDLDNMVTLLAPGTPLLWQSLPEYCIADRYISVGAYEVSRIGVDQRFTVRIHNLPYAVVERPVGPGFGPCGVRWNDLCENAATWDDLTDLSWNDLLLGNASDNFQTQRIWSDVEATFANWSAVEAQGTWQTLRDGT